MRNIREKRIDTKYQIDAGVFEEVRKVFRRAIDIGYTAPAGDNDFIRQLKTNADVFAAFKTHRMGRDIASRLLDDQGNVKSFEQFRTDTASIVDHHVNSWLRTEYDTAIKRAHRAAEMRQFISEADVFPNIEWLPSTAVNPRESHMPFYHHIWAADDPFWEHHKPGDEWGCQCHWASTDEPTTDNSGLGDVVAPPSPGLGGNPARTGQLFSDDHPYFPSDCAHCAFKGRQLSLFSNKTKDCYNCANVTKAIEKADKQIATKHERLIAAKNDAASHISKLDLPSPVVCNSDEFKYGTVVCSKSDIRQLVYHATDVDSVTVSMEMHSHIPELKFVRTEKPKHFTDKKQSRGLVEYVVYELSIGKNTFIVKCEARHKTGKTDILERPYSIYKK